MAKVTRMLINYGMPDSWLPGVQRSAIASIGVEFDEPVYVEPGAFALTSKTGVVVDGRKVP